MGMLVNTIEPKTGYSDSSNLCYDDRNVSKNLIPGSDLEVIQILGTNNLFFI